MTEDLFAANLEIRYETNDAGEVFTLDGSLRGIREFVNWVRDQLGELSSDAVVGDEHD